MTVGPALLALAVAAGTARAGGVSLDIELMQPTWSEGDLPGVDSARISRAGGARGGALFVYARDPLVLYEDGEEIGVPVQLREAMWLGASVDPNPWLSLRAAAPVVLQLGQEATGFAADGIGAGDLRLGARAVPLRLPRLSAGLRADVLLPTGTARAWLGEEGARGQPGVVVTASLGRLDLLGDVSAMLRAPVRTGAQLAPGVELVGNAGARVEIAPDRYALYVAGLSHIGGTSSIEGLFGAQWWPRPWLTVDAGVGKGLSDGYGTTAFRGWLGLGLRRPPPEEPAPQGRDLVIRELPDERTPLVLPPEADAPPRVVWAEGELARVLKEEERIEIRDPIQFEYGTARILPESLPTLEAVASLINADFTLDHVLIEGHASEEGSDAYNYDLAFRRAGAIFEALIVAGVHPYRLSVRSMGEVVPRSAGTDEAALAANRRVEFHIVRRLSPLDPTPTYPPEIPRPWDGAPRAAEPR